MKKKIIVFILCICIISTFCLQPAYAMGAESIIVGGGAAVGLSLTMPQVAIIIAAGFGLVYGIEHADDIANGLNNALENAATNITNGLEELTYWKEQATKGAIALSTAPAWIKDTIFDWVSERYSDMEMDIQSTVPFCADYAANQTIPSANFWQNGTTSFPVPTTIVRCGKSSNEGDYWILASHMFAISTIDFDGGIRKIIDNNTYYVDYLYAGLNPSATKPLAGDNLKAYEAITSLPNYDVIYGKYEGDSLIDKVLNAWYNGFYDSSPVIVGGIDDAIGTHGIDNIKMPDLDIGGSKLLNPGNAAGGSIDDVLGNTLTGLKNNEISWEKYMDDVAVGNPSISIPVEGEGVKDFPITDTGVSDIPIDIPIPDNPAIPGNPSVEVPEGLEPFTISSITDLFPFCIPFDIVDFVNVLCADPEAPCFEWGFPTLDGTTYKMQIDLSPFDSVAQLLRNMELLLFCIGLAMITRNQIRG